MKRFAPVILLAFAVSGCATAWAPVGGQYQASKAGFRAEFPEDWLEVKAAALKATKDPLYKGVAITREGTLLQVIRMGYMDVGTTLSNAKKSLSKGMLPQEAAQVIVDNFQMAEGVLAFNVVENVPVDLGGYPGFRVLMEYKVDDRIWLSRLFYGAIVEDRFYFLHYHAPKRFYFDRDLDTFLKVVESFRPMLS